MKHIVAALFCMFLLPELAMAQKEKAPGISETGTEQKMERGSAITIFSQEHDRFYVLLNGVKQNVHPQTFIRIENVPGIVNEVRIVFDNNSYEPLNKWVSLPSVKELKPINLKLKIEHGKGGGPSIEIFKKGALENNYQASEGEYIMRYCMDMAERFDIGKGSFIAQSDSSAAAVQQHHYLMDQTAFEAAQKAIKANTTDVDKLAAAKSVVDDNYFVTKQIIEFCGLFRLDETRLEFARYAYHKTLDVNNYQKVNVVFDKESSKEALEDYVNKY